MKRYFEYLQDRNSQGITFIELLIVLVIISFILFIGYSMYFLGLKSYSTGIGRSDAQFEIRKAMQFISKAAQTSYKGTVFLYNTNPNTNGYKYIYVDMVSTSPTYGMLMYDDGVNNPIIKAGIANQVTFTSIAFSAPAQGILRVSLTTAGGKYPNTQNYDISSDIKLLNFTTFNPSGSFPSSNYTVLEIRS